MHIQGEDVIRLAAELRGRRKFKEAIDHVLENFGRLDETIQLIGWRECFLAAEEAGDEESARRFAAEIAKEEPNLPSIQSYI